MIDNWQEWDFAKPIDSLRRWTDRNPQNKLNNHQKHRRESVLQTKKQKQPPVHVFTATNKVINLVSTSH